MNKAAINLFRSPPRFLNCAQAVAEAWGSVTAKDTHLVDELHGCGGGQAPEGVCGALHAAHLIVKDKAAIEELSSQFTAAAGSLKCREIRKLGQASCKDCVALAAGFLGEMAKSAAKSANHETERGAT